MLANMPQPADVVTERGSPKQTPVLRGKCDDIGQSGACSDSIGWKHALGWRHRIIPLGQRESGPDSLGVRRRGEYGDMRRTAGPDPDFRSWSPAPEPGACLPA